MFAGLQFGLCGTLAFGLIEPPSLNSLVVPGLVALGVLLLAWGWIKPALSAVASKAKSLIPTFSVSKPAPAAQSTVSSRVALWEQLYEACDPEHGTCPEARKLLTEVFQHLAPYHAEAKK